MIEQLYEQPIYDRYENIYGMSAPSNFELMRKINELVEEVNRLKKEVRGGIVMKMWIARNQDGSLALFRKKRPKLFWDEKVGQYWVGIQCGWILMTTPK